MGHDTSYLGPEGFEVCLELAKKEREFFIDKLGLPTQRATKRYSGQASSEPLATLTSSNEPALSLIT